MDAEIARAAMAAGRITKTGKPDIEGWLKSVTDDQKISREKYLRDSVWPSTALKLIAGDVKVSEEDIQKGFKANFGTRAEVRAIVLDSQRRAQEVWQQARDNPSVEFFGKLAEQYSIEPASRTNQGRVPPIQQFGGQPELEKEAFALKPGEISGIIQVLDKYVILYLEGYTEPVKVKIDEVHNDIYEDIHEKKLRMAMAREFERMKDEASIDNFLAGTSHSPRKKNQVAGANGGRAGQPADAGAVPAAYETTGLLPRTPAAPPHDGAPSGEAAPRSGSVPLPRN
jgi:PPIC-type PPIASE domain